MTRDKDIWDYFEQVLLPQLYPKRWYTSLDSKHQDDDAVRDFPGKLYTNDLNTKFLTGARIRQLRSKKCKNEIE